jgi:hypothetical protein
MFIKPWSFILRRKSQANMCGALMNVGYGPIADICVYAATTRSRSGNHVIRQKGEQRPDLVPT